MPDAGRSMARRTFEVVRTRQPCGYDAPAATPLLRDVATLMLETGMRPEEVYRIQPENVNLAAGFLFNPFGKTKSARRRVPLTTAARNVLSRRMARTGDTLPLPVRNGRGAARSEGK